MHHSPWRCLLEMVNQHGGRGDGWRSSTEAFHLTEPIETKFTITRDEYIRALRRHYRTRFSVARDTIPAIAVVGFGIYLLGNSEQSALAWILIAPGITLLGLVIYARTLLPSMIYRSQPKLKSEYRLSFRDDGIGVRTPQVDAQLLWSIYHSWLRDDEFYILYHGPRELTIIPRRALSEGDDERFGALLQRTIGQARL